ncbi:hypothetical protein [Sporosarcina sp. SAFN-015]|uniref:hypothetical protein n=1 Tax=Sporosarcina sp. SAFN-015 TaxID=3387274 RepID=UPI003F80085B
MIASKNLIFIKAAMQNKTVVSLVEKASAEIWYKLPDATSFEHTCYVSIGKEIVEKEIKSVAAIARYCINRAAARHLKRSKYEAPTSFRDLAISKGNDEESAEYEAEDVLANVENALVMKETQKETISLLAQGDRRRNLVLNAWANGFTDSREISSILADTLGGKSESHRKFITRFKTECRAVLTA